MAWSVFGVSVIVAAVTAVLSAGGFAIGALFPGLAKEALISQLQDAVSIDSKDATGYGVWASSSKDPVHYEIYGWNVSNAAEVMRSGAKPVLNETKFAQYTLKQDRINVSYSDGGKMVEFLEWDHVGNCEQGPCHEKLVVPNLVMLALKAKYGALIDDIVYDVVYGKDDFHKLWQERSIEELAFGYVDPVLEDFKTILGWLHIHFQDGVPGTVGNVSRQGAYKSVGWTAMKTGKGNWGQARQLTKWNGMESLRCCLEGPCGAPDTMNDTGTPTWLTEEANRVTGTWGQQFAPGGRISPGDEVEVFVDNIFRSAVLKNRNKESVVWKGITAHRFTIPPSLLENSTTNPANAAYRMDGPRGLFNISACAGQIPILVSKPHFLDADPRLREAVIGMKPNRTLHDTHLDIELNSGVTVVTKERLQVNVMIEPIGNLFPNLKPVILPVMWVQKAYTINNEQSASLREGIEKAEVVASVTLYAGFGIGIASALACVFFTFRAYSAGTRQGYSFTDPDAQPDDYTPLHDTTYEHSSSDRLMPVDEESSIYSAGQIQ